MSNEFDHVSVAAYEEAIREIASMHNELRTKQSIRERRFRNALVEIAKGEGRFSQDHFQHAKNTIEDMTELAETALRFA